MLGRMTHMPDPPAPALPPLLRVEAGPALPRSLCTDCGLSRTARAGACGHACQFIRPDYPALERAVHGRARDPGRGDELHFGPYRQMLRARLVDPAPGAQWTGITTALGAELLSTGAVEAVVCMVADPQDRWRPSPAIITRASAMAQARGMRMGYAPLLVALEEAVARGLRRIALIGIPCQVHALRKIERDLGLEALFVIGTPCSDNTTTEKFHAFLDRLSDRPETITYLEFRADYRVELRFEDGTRREIPFLDLPLSDLPPDFFPLTCRTCVDYANVLADITVGYMAGGGDQWLIVRNARGAQLLESLGSRLWTSAPPDRGRRRAAVAGFIENTRLAAGGLPLRRMPRWVRPIVSWLQPRIGPRGVEFARARLEMKAAEAVLHLRRTAPRKMKWMLPAHVWQMVAPYGLTPEPGETRLQTERAAPDSRTAASDAPAQGADPARPAEPGPSR